jgi:hypothetical protein
MLMYISLFTAANPENYTSEFRGISELLCIPHTDGRAKEDCCEKTCEK